MEEPILIAYRAWRFYDDRLQSTNAGRGHSWQSISAIATCDHGCDIANCLMEHKCSCGLYSVKSMSLLKNHGVWGEVYGQISLYGVVVEFDYGYRSEMAAIQVLYCDDRSIRESLAVNYPGVPIEPLPELLKQKPDYSNAYDEAYKKRQKVLAERNAQLEANKKKYPFGFTAEMVRVETLLHNKSKEEVQAFAKEYGESKEWAPRIWAWKPETSRKYKPGSIVFAANDDQVPYFYVGSTRAKSAQSSIRLLLTVEGILVKRTNIRNWDEEDKYKNSRAEAVANW